MEYKPDWDSAKERIEAYWENEIIDRCCIAVTAPRKTSPYGSYNALQLGLGASLEAVPEDDSEAIRCWWTDPELNYQRMINWFENTCFAGEAAPATFVNWGAMALAAFYGSQPEFRKETVWYHPVIENLETWQWQFDEATNLYWQQSLNIVKVFAERCNGRYFVGTPEFGTAGDLLTLMRGTEQFSLDLVETPDAAHKAIEVLADTWVRLHEQVYQITQPHNDGGGVLHWMLLWAPGRTSQLACDFAAMISPRMYRKFFVPEVETEGNWCEYGVYHLDGPQAMRSTLDILLNIPQIKTIQWTPGENLAPTYSPEYIPMYQKIQQTGKRLYLLVEPREIEPILRELSPRGLFLRTHTDSEDEAETLLARVEQWSARKNIFPVG